MPDRNDRPTTRQIVLREIAIQVGKVAYKKDGPKVREDYAANGGQNR